MMGNKDYLSGGCDLPGKLCYEKLDLKIKKKKTEIGCMIFFIIMIFLIILILLR